MTWWRPWRREVADSHEALKTAQELRDKAEDQNRRVAEQAVRVDAAAQSLRQLRSENHFGPMIEQILRGAK